VWLDEAFRKVSVADPGCGEEYEAVLSTRDEPEFVYIRSNHRFAAKRLGPA
jgi:hypothetical protein